MSRLKAIGAWLRAGWVAPVTTQVTLPPRRLTRTLRNQKVAHESGHALLAWLCSHAEVVGLDLEDQGNGKVTYVTYRSPSRQSDLAWAQVVISLGGIAGELHVYSRFRSGTASRDLAQAREAAADVRTVPAGSAAPDAVFDRPVFQVPLDDHERTVLNAALGEARRLLIDHQARYWRLVDRCLGQDQLAAPEIEAALGSREPIRFLRACGVVTFWRGAR